jgi:hypothetical protein
MTNKTSPQRREGAKGRKGLKEGEKASVSEQGQGAQEGTV